MAEDKAPKNKAEGAAEKSKDEGAAGETQGRLTTFKVLREQDGLDEDGNAKLFQVGDTRKLNAGEAAHLVASGALEKA
jgi:hypothetical protein